MVASTLHGVEDILGSSPIIIFILSFVNIGCHVVSHRGLACTFWASCFASNPHFPLILFSYPGQGFAIDAILLLLCLQNTPYRLHEISLREREASKTASQHEKIHLLCHISFGAGDPGGNAFCLGLTSDVLLGHFPYLSVQFTERSGIWIWWYGRVGFVLWRNTFHVWLPCFCFPGIMDRGLAVKQLSCSAQRCEQETHLLVKGGRIWFGIGSLLGCI